jgi:hypothetical protein
VPIIELWQRGVPLIVTAGVANLPASQLLQIVDPAIFVHTLSHTTLCNLLHLNIS